MPLLQLCFLFRRELLVPVFPQCLKQAEACLLSIRLCEDQRALPKLREVVQCEWPRADGFCRYQAPAAAKHRQPGKESVQCRCEEAIAPFDRRMECLVSPCPVPLAAHQELKP